MLHLVIDFVLAPQVWAVGRHRHTVVEEDTAVDPETHAMGIPRIGMAATLVAEIDHLAVLDTTTIVVAILAAHLVEAVEMVATHMVDPVMKTHMPTGVRHLVVDHLMKIAMLAEVEAAAVGTEEAAVVVAAGTVVVAVVQVQAQAPIWLLPILEALLIIEARQGRQIDGGLRSMRDRGEAVIDCAAL